MSNPLDSIWPEILAQKLSKIVKYKDEYYRVEECPITHQLMVLNDVHNSYGNLFLEEFKTCFLQKKDVEIIAENGWDMRISYLFELCQALISDSFDEEHKGHLNSYNINYNYFDDNYNYAIAKRGNIIMLLKKNDYSTGADFDIDKKNYYFKDVYTVIKSNCGHSKKPDILAGLNLIIDRKELVLTNFIKEVERITLSEENMYEIFDEVINVYNRLK